MPRLSKLTAEMKTEIENYLSLGCTVINVCELVGINESTFYVWKNKYKEFSEAATRAQAKAHLAAVAAVRTALVASKSVTNETHVFQETRFRKDKDGVEVPYLYTRTTTINRETTHPPDWKAGIEFLKRRDTANWSDKVIIEDDAWRREAIELIKSGSLTYEVLADAFDDAGLATDLFKAAGVPISA